MSLVYTCVCCHFPVKSQLFRPNMSCYRLIIGRPRDETVTGESFSAKVLIVFKNNFSSSWGSLKVWLGESFLVQLFPLGIFAIVQVLQISTRWERRGDTSIPLCMGLYLFIKRGETREEITSFGFSTFYWCCCCCCFWLFTQEMFQRVRYRIKICKLKS